MNTYNACRKLFYKDIFLVVKLVSVINSTLSPHRLHLPQSKLLSLKRKKKKELSQGKDSTNLE